MKKFLFSLFAVLCCVATINAQLVGVVVESANDGSQKIAQSALAAAAFCPGANLTPQPAGTTTYRVYAELQDSDDFLSAMFGIPAAGTNPTCYPLAVNTTTSFFNSAIGHADGTGIIEAACGSFPDVYYDSFMTIGRERSDDPGAVGNQWSANPFTNPFTAGVGNVLGTDGAIFATNGSPNALPTGPNNRVLLGQFTTSGELSFNINVNVFDGGDGVGGNLQYIAYEIDNTNCAVPGTALDGISLGCVFPAPVGADGCTDATACNYDVNATNDDGSCEFAVAADCEVCSGETDGTGTIVVEDADGDGVCDGDEIAGCQDATACNYNMAATDDDGSCEFAVAADCEVCSGETDGTGSIVVEDADGDGVCDGDEIAGCTDAAACNFDAAATDDDGSCEFASCAGCTDPTACNFNPAATVTDNTLCEFASCAGCTDSGACNFDASATLDDGSCEFAVAADCEVCSGETDGTGTIVVEDADGDGVCDGDEVDGCTDITACNFDPAATEDDGSCILPDGCTDSGACNFDPAAVCDDGSCDFSCFGCTDPAANNFDPAATIDDGTCTFDPVNDSPAQAFSLGLSVSNGPCNGLSGDMADASTADAAGSATVDSDLWYTFVPFSSGARIEVNTVDFDALIEVLDAGLNTLSVEDAAAFNGSEAYHVGDLTAGDTYYIRVGSVAATAGAAPFDVCVKTLRDSRCDYGSGPYSLCGIFKADFAFADSYIFNFTSNTTGITYTSAPQSSTFINFDQVDGMQYDDDYTVEIQTVYMTTDGAGNPVMTIVEADESCSVTIGSPITTQMSPEDNATNAGPQFLGNYIIAEDYICGVESYEWTFDNVSGEDLPIIVEGNGPTRWLQISDALNESALGQTFDVTVRANFGGGVYGDAGATQQLSIIGVVTAQDEPGIAEIAQDATRSEVVEATANVYPNPTTGDIVNINVTDIDATVELVTVDVMDNLGKVVASRVMNANNGSVQNTMNLSQLTAGMYHVRITAGDQLVNTTLMIQK